MGAEPWFNFTNYHSNIQTALENLRNEVFESGDYRYSEEHPASIEEALEIADADGTASILDISHIADEPAFCCAAAFTAEEMRAFFGSETPTRADIEQAEEHWDALERGQARFAIVHSDGKPTEIYFAGYSFD